MQAHTGMLSLQRCQKQANTCKYNVSQRRWTHKIVMTTRSVPNLAGCFPYIIHYIVMVFKHAHTCLNLLFLNRCPVWWHISYHFSMGRWARYPRRTWHSFARWRVLQSQLLRSSEGAWNPCAIFWTIWRRSDDPETRATRVMRAHVKCTKPNSEWNSARVNGMQG
jgi:hypothetical protein